MGQRRGQATPQAHWRAVERRWRLGYREFKEQLLARIRERRGDRYGPELREAGELCAERLAQQEMRRPGWGEPELARRRKGDPHKVGIARRLRRESTMTLKWIAQRRQMGTRTHVSNYRVHRHKAQSGMAAAPRPGRQRRCGERTK